MHFSPENLCAIGASLLLILTILAVLIAFTRGAIDCMPPDRWRPPVADTQVIPVGPISGSAYFVRPDRGQIVDIRRRGERMFTRDIPTVHYTVQPIDADHPLSIPDCDAEFDDGTTLRLVRRAWPHWWQRILLPTSRQDIACYLIPRAWVPPQQK